MHLFIMVEDVHLHTKAHERKQDKKRNKEAFQAD